MGYSVIKEDRERRIVINETGKKLRKAFEWKAKGIKNDEILSRLKAMGVKIYKQKLSMTFSNPFYCGIIANKTLNGKLVEGKHEKLISKELFLSIHQKRTEAKGKYGVSHKKENDKFPLKLFMKCEKCNNGYTGYTVKKKNKTSSKVHQFNYYKCRTVGCKCNKNTTMVDQDFIAFLKEYSIQPHLVAPLLYYMNYAFDKHHSTAISLKKTCETNLSAIEKKMEELEEDFYLNKKIPENTYIRLIAKLLDEKQEILKNLPPTDLEISNLQKYFEAGITISTKLATVWDSSPVGTKEKIQKTCIS